MTESRTWACGWTGHRCLRFRCPNTAPCAGYEADLLTDTCSIVHYIAGGMMTEGRYVNPDHAKRCSDVGRWYPIPAGFRSEDGRTLILRDAASKYHDWAKAKAEEHTTLPCQRELQRTLARLRRKREMAR